MMKFLQQFYNWISRYNPKWLVIIRVTLGILLFVKGFVFIQNTAILADYVSKTALIKNIGWLTTVIPWLHLLGGTMIIAGLFTRLAVLAQIPILIGAVFFVNVRQGTFAGQSDLLFSIIILLLLMLFLLKGGGTISLDNYFKKSFKKTETNKLAELT